jgi:hypothetical protein
MNKQIINQYSLTRTKDTTTDPLEPNPHFTILLPTRLGLPKGQLLMYFPSFTSVLNAPPESLSLSIDHSKNMTLVRL